MDTIYALATAPGLGAIAVVRISGPAAHDTIGTLTVRPAVADRKMRLRNIASNGQVLDQALVVCFPDGRSATGERYAELHLHGGRAVVSAVLSALAGLGLRVAQPGEFSRRALAAGKMDLSQLEGVVDLVAAETEAQRRQALRLVVGDGHAQVMRWRALLTEAWAAIEATIDFTDEDLPETLVQGAHSLLDSLHGELSTAARETARASRLRDGFEVVLVGAPNSGKSSLLNAIAGKRVALTSPMAGTTRDMIELRVELDGLPVTFVDTAGLRESSDAVEAEGVALARKRASEADLVLRITSIDTVTDDEPAIDGMLVWNKADIANGSGIAISALTGAGVDGLLTTVAAKLREGVPGASVFTRRRHREAVLAAQESISAAMVSAPEVASLHLRDATKALESIIGKIDSEDVLADIFGRFCIGK